MTVKIYVAKDQKGRQWAPDRPHEVGACEWMVKKAWDEFHDLKEFYAILLNHQPEPRTDMVVIQERGLGVLEMKHYYNEIEIHWDGPWWVKAKKKLLIHAADHLNPREQVRTYAASLRNLVIRDIVPPPLQTNKKHWDKLKFQTAVCFTNHLAILEQAKHHVEIMPPDLEPWEDGFSIFGIRDFTAWVRELRFEGQAAGQEPIRLEPEKIEKIVTRNLSMVEWTEIYPAIMSGHPYGALTLDNGQVKQVFNLLRDQTLVGRSHSCEIVIPERFPRVSKEHCVIEKKNGAIFLYDKSSRNGTFHQDQRVERESPVCLQDGDVIRLGGTESDHACILRFNLIHKWEGTLVTEPGSQIV